MLALFRRHLFTDPGLGWCVYMVCGWQSWQPPAFRAAETAGRVARALAELTPADRAGRLAAALGVTLPLTETDR